MRVVSHTHVLQSLSTQQEIIDLVDSNSEDNNEDELIDLSEGGELPTLASVLEEDLDLEYGLLAPEQTILIKAYSDDADDKLLEETSPRFIIMYEPNPEFVRRIEVRVVFIHRERLTQGAVVLSEQ